MAPTSKTQIINDVFNALVEVPDFNLSREQLDDALSKSNFQISKTSKTTSDSSSKKRMSAYRMFQKDHNKSTGFDKEQAKTRWEEIKADKLLLSEYDDKANQWNIDNGFGSKEEAKNAKKSEKQMDQQSLKDEILKLKLQLQNKTQSKPESESKPESQPESEPESEKDESESKPEKDESESEKDESESKPEKDESESEKDEPESESEKDESESKPEKDESESEKDESESKPEKDESESKPESESEKDEPESESEKDESESEDELESESEVIKPKYEGKNPHTSLNNYKEWKKNELNVDKINSGDLKKFQSEDNYDKNKYNDSLPWFEFIKNNFTIE